MSKFPCPVCQYLTFNTTDTTDSNETCPICQWRIDLHQVEYPNDDNGNNKVSLNQAIEHYKMFKACHIEYVQTCRSPNVDEIPNYSGDNSVNSVNNSGDRGNSSGMNVQSDSLTLLEGSNNSSNSSSSSNINASNNSASDNTTANVQNTDNDNDNANAGNNDNQSKIKAYSQYISEVSGHPDQYDSSEDENETQEIRENRVLERSAKCRHEDGDGATSEEDFDLFQTYQPIGDFTEISEFNGNSNDYPDTVDTDVVDGEGVVVSDVPDSDPTSSNEIALAEVEVTIPITPITPIVPTVPTIPPLSNVDIDIIRNTMSKLSFRGRFALDAVVDQILVRKPRVGDECESELDINDGDGSGGGNV